MINMEMGLRKLLKFAVFFDAEYSHMPLSPNGGAEQPFWGLFKRLVTEVIIPGHNTYFELSLKIRIIHLRGEIFRDC